MIDTQQPRILSKIDLHMARKDILRKKVCLWERAYAYSELLQLLGTCLYEVH